METIAVVGAGVMGAGITQLAATHGCTVHLVDVNESALTRAIDEITRSMARFVQKGKTEPAERDAILGRIRTSDTVPELGDVTLAIEAVVEDLAVKRQVFVELDEATPPSAALASNTSSLSISRIAEAVRDRRRIIGMHFFNPVPAMALVEVIAGEASDDSFVDLAFKTARSWGKMPVLAKDTPGFIVNRIARGFYLEAVRLLAEGVAGVDEIDGVMRTHGGFKMGPFELMDLIGLDVNLAVTTSLWERTNRPARFEPHGFQQTLVERRHLGRKSGRGFYTYERQSPLPACPVDRRSFELSPLLADAMLSFSMRAGAVQSARTEQYIFSRILGAVINEAGLAYAEGVASSADIDIAMVTGTNYPRGPLAWADDIGHRTVRGLLKELNNNVGDGRYEPAPLFQNAT